VPSAFLQGYPHAGGVPYPNPTHALSIVFMGFQSVRLLAVLHRVELMACLAPCRQGKGAQVIEKATAKIDRLGVSHATIM